MDEEKFIGRIENMLFNICGCTKEEAIIILEKCLAKIKNHKNLKKIPLYKKRNY